LVDLDGIFILTPMVPMVPELAREIERMRLEAGLSVEDLLAGLREQRERYYREKYAVQRVI
ncbi:MAG: AbrB/MazE/SpoVT family DNA-binding domain-containing protein, partial [Anaerolineae bacterium]